MSGFNLGDTSVKTTLKYGLNPAAKKKAKAKPLGGPIAAFAGGDDSDDDDAGERARANAEVLRQQAAARRDRQVRARADLSSSFGSHGHRVVHLAHPPPSPNPDPPPRDPRLPTARLLLV